MNQELWNEVDRYFEDSLLGRDDGLAQALAASADAGLPAIAVSPTQGKMLHLFARMLGARRVLEVGTLGGYSAIWLARALPADGKLVSLEIDPKHADVARKNLARAGLGGVAEVRVGPALESLRSIEGPFDFVFIDADKPNNANYFRAAVDLVRAGGAIVVDNIARSGKVVDEASTDANVRGVRELMTAIANEPRVTATAIQTVGAKGYDGFLLAMKR
ncbi:MAG TPA: O-methyltransferase [Polyangiaceae bacterium]|jgi:predicted O-methyltransferase YrrM